MAMKKLSEELRSILSSTLQINNFKTVVEELVYNSLDGKATSIAIRIDIPEKKIQVIDNGCGIIENDFDLIGQKYCTSKCTDVTTLKSAPNTYGFRGQFLANLINIAQKVKVTSRFDKGEDTWVKIFYDGKDRDLAKTTTRPSVGTTVEISGLFYNLHIQSKNVESLNELNEIKTLLKQLSLIYNNISISLRDDSKNEIVFKVHKNRNIYQTFGMLFNLEEKDIQEFKVEKKEYKATAYFSKKDQHIGKFQWIYLNGKFISNCKLHHIVNEELRKSLKPLMKRKVKKTKEMFSKEDDEDVFTKRNLPFYVILLSCPYYDYDISNLAKHCTLEFRNWQNITNLLKKLILFYTGDEKFTKQLKCEKTANIDLKPKSDEVSDEYMKDQVRKIVEKLLKSNSKKLGVSQMHNGVKGKSTKRRKIKKDTCLQISLSRVIPSKNKLVRQISRDGSKKSELNEVPLVSLPEGSPVKDLHDVNNLLSDNINKHQTTLTRNSYIKERCQQKRKQENQKHKNTIKNYSEESMEFASRKKICCTRRNSNIIQNNYNVHTFKDQYEKMETKMHHQSDISQSRIQSDYVETIDFSKFQNKYSAEFYNNVTQNYRVGADMYNCFNEKEHLMKDNDTTTIYNFSTSNTKVTLREKVEEIIVYDYIPHPLNSKQNCDLYKNSVKEKPHFSSRDLVKTILNTQSNISIHRPIYLSSEDTFKPQRSGTLTNSKDILAISPEVMRDKIESVVKNTRSSTFDAWNSDFHPDLHLRNEIRDESLCFTKMTYESHYYSNNICNEKTRNTKLKRTEQFITKQSEDNFIVTKDKQNNKLHKKISSHKNKYKSKYLYKPKVTKNNDVSMAIGIKNFFKISNLMPGSSLTIDFSNSTGHNIICSSKLNDNIIGSSLSKWPLHSKINQEHFGKTSVNSFNKNTYTIAGTSLDARYDSYFLNQHYECIRYNNNNLMQGTYTIETGNEEHLYNCLYSEEENKEDTTLKEQNGLNIVFISEPQIEVSGSSSNKIIEPIDLCETVFDNSRSNSSLDSLTHMEDVVNEIYNDITELADKQKNLSTNISLPEVSHHFNTTINNTNNVAISNRISISNRDQNNVTVNATTTNDYEILKESNDLTNQNIPNNDDMASNFSIKNRPRFMPKGMSQIFENCNTKVVCEYNFDGEYFKYNIYEDFSNEVQINSEIFQPKVQNASEDTTKAIEKVETKLHKEHSSLIFDGKLLKQAQVLGQVDDKFIAAVIKSKSKTADFLVLFDQHAVHERIRLEKNMADYFNQHEWKKVKLDDFLLKLSKDEVLYLHNYKEKFAQLGLEWNILGDCELSVFSIPEAILGKNPRQADKVIAAVKNLFLEEIDTIKSQGGCICLQPKSIMDLVFSEACRYAIKFGDKLTITDCRDLIRSLSDCKTPFQCAHGRPVMAVLMEISNYYVHDYKTDISKIRLFSLNKTKQEMNAQK